MPRGFRDGDILPSILDRLRQEPQGSAKEAYGTQDLEDYIGSVMRDLEALLNTQQEIESRLIDWVSVEGGGNTWQPVRQDLPEEYAELRRSVLTYGLPDFTTFNVHNKPDRDAVEKAVRQAIMTFEPRLSRVQVTAMEPEPYDHFMRLRIEALLRVEPAPEPVMFEAFMQLNTRTYQVKETTDAG
jgi:type VI secretion system protein ImpF